MYLPTNLSMYSGLLEVKMISSHENHSKSKTIGHPLGGSALIMNYIHGYIYKIYVDTCM